MLDGRIQTELAWSLIGKEYANEQIGRIQAE